MQRGRAAMVAAEVATAAVVVEVWRGSLLGFMG
jgi:hypothetical protein